MCSPWDFDRSMGWNTASDSNYNNIWLGNKTIDEIDITYVPAAVYAYNIGVNTLEMKSNW